MPETPAPAKKIVDITHADEVAPGATARPVLASNHTMLVKDPMMAAPAENPTELLPASAEPGPENHQAKTITPLTQQAPEAEATKESKGEKDEKDEAKEDPEEKLEEVAPEKQPEPEATEDEPDKEADDEAEDTPAAELTDKKADAEEEARRAELEELIESGVYAVPINAVHRKHSRVLLLVIALVLVVAAVVALDVLLDMGTIQIPGVPRTNFL